MLNKEILDRLSYSKCDCPIDYRANLGVVNGICPKHPESKLLIDGTYAEAKRRPEKKLTASKAML